MITVQHWRYAVTLQGCLSIFTAYICIASKRAEIYRSEGVTNCSGLLHKWWLHSLDDVFALATIYLECRRNLRVQFSWQVLYMLNFDNTARRDTADVLLSCGFPCKMCLIQETVTSVLFWTVCSQRCYNDFCITSASMLLFEYMSVPPGKLPEEKEMELWVGRSSSLLHATFARQGHDLSSSGCLQTASTWVVTTWPVLVYPLHERLLSLQTWNLVLERRHTRSRV